LGGGGEGGEGLGWRGLCGWKRAGVMFVYFVCCVVRVVHVCTEARLMVGRGLRSGTVLAGRPTSAIKLARPPLACSTQP